MVEAEAKSLDADVLMRVAREAAGLRDFGDQGFEGPLQEHLAAASRSGAFSEAGLDGFAAAIVNQLVNRLRMVDDLKAHPEIRGEDVSDPVVIFGLPRTGSTKLQRMMSMDPANQPLLYWKLLNFAPFPDAVAGLPDPRIEVAKAACEQMATSYPELLKIHPIYHDQPEEEVFLISTSYEHFGNSAQLSDERYCEYIRSRPPENAFRYLRTILQYLQWQQGGPQGPWILKAPTHLGSVAPLFSVFPNATLVQTHRDPPTVFASLCHLIESAAPMAGMTVDPHRIGREQLAMWKAMWDRNEAQRAELAPDARFLDIDYGEIKDDPFAVIERIYARADRRLSKPGRAAMKEWQAENRQNRHGKHEYNLAHYGVEQAEVEEAFRSRTPFRSGESSA